MCSGNAIKFTISLNCTSLVKKACFWNRTPNGKHQIWKLKKVIKKWEEGRCNGSLLSPKRGDSGLSPQSCWELASENTSVSSVSPGWSRGRCFWEAPSNSRPPRLPKRVELKPILRCSGVYEEWSDRVEIVFLTFSCAYGMWISWEDTDSDSLRLGLRLPIYAPTVGWCCWSWDHTPRSKGINDGRLSEQSQLCHSFLSLLSLSFLFCNVKTVLNTYFQRMLWGLSR